MADYGLHIKNNSGEILIDSTYRNYVLKQTGSNSIIKGGNSIDFTGRFFQPKQTPPSFIVYTELPSQITILLPLIFLEAEMLHYIGNLLSLDASRHCHHMD